MPVILQIDAQQDQGKINTDVMTICEVNNYFANRMVRVLITPSFSLISFSTSSGT